MQSQASCEYHGSNQIKNTPAKQKASQKQEGGQNNSLCSLKPHFMPETSPNHHQSLKGTFVLSL